MSRRMRFVCALLAASGVSIAVAAEPLGQQFTYQGQLLQAGTPVTDSLDFSFQLCEDVACSTPVGAPLEIADVPVVNGLFSVELNFGPGAFSGAARWLAISVGEQQAGGAGMTPLVPPQALTAAPYALYTLGAGLNLPYAGSFAGTDQTALSINQTGLGYAAYFSSNNASNYYGTLVASGNTTGPTFFATHSNGGTVARFQSVGAPNNVPTVLATSFGTGAALYGSGGVGTNATGIVGSGTGTGNGVRAIVDGTGNAVHATVTGNDGRAGFFQVTSQFSPQNVVEIQANGNSTSQALYAQHTGAGDCGLFEISNATNTGEAVEARTNGTGTAVEAVTTGTGRAGWFQINNAANANPALYCTTNGTGLALQVAGRARVNVLEILGGADLSEGFDVSGAGVQPGMVVVIDPDSPGRLKVATTPYDRKVAGIVAGAGGVQPGMLMKQEGSLASGTSPVALSGRVYCLADASAAAIEPGDLLATSATPGHAMKAEDAARSHGAILGKAMTGLTQGETGLVLVLVALQ